MYDSFRFLGTEIALHEEATDLYLESGTGDGYGEYLLTVEDGGVKSYYQNAYKAINYANGLIHYAGEGTSLAIPKVVSSVILDIIILSSSLVPCLI